MAYTKKNISTKETTIPTPPVTEQVVENIITETPKKKKFDGDDLIECRSLTAGELFYAGGKTKALYTFADIGDTVEIPFMDLDYSARAKDALMYKPRFIVMNADFVALHPALDEIYSKLHTNKELKDILKLPADQMKTEILALPIGAQEALKTIAATMVDNGTLDSIKRVKAIDDIFGTSMFKKMMDN